MFSYVNFTPFIGGGERKEDMKALLLTFASILMITAGFTCSKNEPPAPEAAQEEAAPAADMAAQPEAAPAQDAGMAAPETEMPAADQGAAPAGN